MHVAYSSTLHCWRVSSSDSNLAGNDMKVLWAHNLSLVVLCELSMTSHLLTSHSLASDLLASQRPRVFCCCHKAYVSGEAPANWLAWSMTCKAASAWPAVCDLMGSWLFYIFMCHHCFFIPHCLHIRFMADTFFYWITYPDPPTIL